MKGNEISRRTFIKTAAVGTAGLLVFPQCTLQTKSSDWRFFTNEEAGLVDAIVEQIIPTDEWMGAKDAGVTNYIDRQLVGPLSRFQEKYRKGLEEIRISCRKIYDKPFEKLPWDEQTKFLKSIEKGEFFRLVRDHTMQGYYGSPRHGGNKNYVSYNMLGLDYPVIEGRNKYE